MSVRVTTTLHITTWPTPLAVAQCVFLPRSTEPVSGSDFPWCPGHLAQPQGLEPSPSPLHQQDVSILPMPDAPLGFSGTGSPMPCHYASGSEIETRTETRPDAPTRDGQKSKSLSSPKTSPKALGVPTSSSQSTASYSRRRTYHSHHWYQVCGVPRASSKHRSESLRLSECLRSRQHTRPATLQYEYLPPAAVRRQPEYPRVSRGCACTRPRQESLRPAGSLLLLQLRSARPI